jgi:hypothetical protein
MATDFVALAQRLIASRGRACTLVKLAATAANPAKPWNGPGVPTEQERVDVVACFVPPSGTDLGRGFITEEQLKRCDQVALVAPGEQDYAAFGVLEDEAVRWKIEWVQVLKPGPLVLLYALGVKR